MSNPSVGSLLDLPEEMIVKIILQLDPIERLTLGNSCQRFNDLVYCDEELLRNLDFTGERQLTRASDIQEYFNDENTCKKIRRINTENVRAVSSLKSSISKAINLVELNILNGMYFASVEELSGFLKPLVHLKRLSVNWPGEFNKRASYADPEWNQLLKEPFSRLTYLSLEVERYTNQFLLILQLCQELEQLRLLISKDGPRYGNPLRQKLMKLSNLKIVSLIGSEDAGLLRSCIMCILMDPAEWTDFHPDQQGGELYLEKNVEICAKLSQVKEMPPPRNVPYYRETGFSDKDWPLVPVHLLSEVIRVTHEDAPKEFCCLSSPGFPFNQPCVLKIDEIKKLLKDPEHQISYLHFLHPIEKNCDAHLLASAFPKLTELVLSGIIKKNSMSVPEETKPLYRLRRRGSLASEEEHSDARNTDSSFKMLVDNTPSIKILEISQRYWVNKAEHWDLDALYLISGWKNLTVIRLYDVPITDGRFLIGIGKECKKLEQVMLHSGTPDGKCSYESALVEMLQHCKNLKKLTIERMSLKLLAEMFNVLSNCPRLAALHLPIIDRECDPVAVTSPVEEMIRECQELKRFSINLCSHFFGLWLRRDINRITSKLNRSDFQFRITEPI